MDTEKLCIVVPCFDEEEALEPFFTRMYEVMKAVPARMTAEQADFLTSAEFILVDDGSTDTTLAIIKRLRETDPRIHYVSFSRNFGKEAAMAAGLEASLERDASHVIVMDVDLQDPPELIWDMVARMSDTGCDVVAAYRTSRAGEPRVRSWFAHRFYGLMNRFTNVEMKDGARDFRLMTRQVVEAIVSLPESERFSKGIFAWVGFDTEWVGYENVERTRGTSNWSFVSLVRYAFSGITAFSTTPLEIISMTGLGIFLLAIVSLIFVIVRALAFGDPVAGWPSLVCIVLLLGGLNLLAGGIIGLYLSKVYGEVKGRPLYIVKEQR